MYHIFIHSAVDGDLDCFHVPAIANSAAMSTMKPHGLQPTKFPHLWNFAGKTTGVGCHCLLHPTPLGHNKAPVWAPGLMQQLPTS